LFPNVDPKFSASHEAFCYLVFEAVLHCLLTLKHGLEFEKLRVDGNSRKYVLVSSLGIF